MDNNQAGHNTAVSVMKPDAFPQKSWEDMTLEMHMAAAHQMTVQDVDMGTQSAELEDKLGARADGYRIPPQNVVYYQRVKAK